VAEIDEGMSYRELMDWYCFESQVSPLPDRLADIHNATLITVLINLWRGADTQPAQASDFFVIRTPEPPPPDDGLTDVERQMRNWRGEN
jgi:hypothetical protein